MCTVVYAQSASLLPEVVAYAVAMPAHLVPSRRGRSGDDPIFALSKLAAERRARNEPTINATLGALFDDGGQLITLPTLAKTLQAMSEAAMFGYAPIAGLPAFLEAVKDDVLHAYPHLRARAVAVATPGGTGAIRHALTTLLEERQVALTTSFHWSPYRTIAEEHGRSIATFNMFRDGAFDAAALDAAIQDVIAEQGRALLLLNDPCHNPTGYSMSEQDWTHVRDVVARHADKAPVSIVLDIAYAAFSPGSLDRPLRALSSVADRVLVALCWSASKSFLAYGQRVGALVCVPADESDRSEIESALVFACRGVWSNCNHAAMHAIAKLLTEPSLREATANERAVAIELLTQRVRAWNAHATKAGLNYPRYDGGFFVTLSVKEPQDHAARLRERGVFVVPLHNALRVALCSVPERDIERLVAEIVATGAALCSFAKERLKPRLNLMLLRIDRFHRNVHALGDLLGQ